MEYYSLFDGDRWRILQSGRKSQTSGTHRRYYSFVTISTLTAYEELGNNVLLLEESDDICVDEIFLLAVH